MADKKNVSSGAEKAEKLALANKESKSRSGENKGQKKSVTAASKKSAKSAPAKSEKKSAKGAKSAKSAKISERKKAYKERKQRRLERRLEHKEKVLKRRAELKEAREKRKERADERRAAAKERKQLLKSESRQDRRERVAEEKKAKREAAAAKREAYLAEKRARREHALKVRAQKRAERAENKRTPGFGGWLAAVISLGVTTLALGTIVTFGWLTMNDMQASMASGYTQSLYELNAIVDNLDADLARAKVSSSAGDRVRVFADIAAESQAAETVLERFPVELQLTEQLASFVNKMSDSAKDMLYTVAAGGELSPSQVKSLEYMYESNRKLKKEINELAAECDGQDLLNAMRGKGSILGDGFTVIQNNTFEVPKGIQDGPFSDSVKKTNPKALKGAEEITAQRAEKLAREYFADYEVSGARCTGEIAAEKLSLYNVEIDTKFGEMMVQISKLGGKVVSFDSFKDCADKNFSVERCEDIARDFLSSLGYGKLVPVWVSENGTTCNMNFAPKKSGAVLYPDLIKVKVCEERGIVTGIEAMSYVLNHGEREVGEPAISEERARESINGEMEVAACRLALIPFEGEERLCYEFYGSVGENEYYAYVDAVTGEEIEVLTVVGTKQGRALM